MGLSIAFIFLLFCLVVFFERLYYYANEEQRTAGLRALRYTAKAAFATMLIVFLIVFIF